MRMTGDGADPIRDWKNMAWRDMILNDKAVRHLGKKYNIEYNSTTSKGGMHTEVLPPTQVADWFDVGCK